MSKFKVGDTVTCNRWSEKYKIIFIFDEGKQAVIEEIYCEGLQRSVMLEDFKIVPIKTSKYACMGYIYLYDELPKDSIYHQIVEFKYEDNVLIDVKLHKRERGLS